MLLKLGVDILWTHLFPLLGIDELCALYNTHPSFRPIIEEYKPWDDEYSTIFNCDAVTPPLGQVGFRKVAKRVQAVPFIWGPFSAKVLWDEPRDYVMKGLMNEVYSPNAIDTRQLGAIKQFVSDRGVITTDGRVARFTTMLDNIGSGIVADDGYESDGDQEYGSFLNPRNLGKWKYEDEWPENVERLYTSDFDIYAIDKKTLYHLPQRGSFKSVQFAGKIIKVEFDFSHVFALVEGVGLVCGFAEVPEVTFTTVLPASLFPGPIVDFCILQGQGYAVLTKAHKVFTFFLSDGRYDRRSVQFPCNIQSIHSFVHKCEMDPIEENILRLRTARGMVRLETGCFVALGTDGKVYYYTKRTDVLILPLPLPHNVVKVVTRHSVLITLTCEGQLFFLGATDLINPGVGMEAAETIVCEAYKIRDRHGQPDLLKAWQYSGPILYEGNEVDLREDKIYCARASWVPFDGVVLDVNILGRQVSALVMPPCDV